MGRPPGCPASPSPAPLHLLLLLPPRSLFILSNETVNIWSHLLGFLLFLALGVYDLVAVLPAAGASREDFVICFVCLFCFQVAWRRETPSWWCCCMGLLPKVFKG